MQQLISDFKPLCGVQLPFQGRRMYMHSFSIENPVMAEGYEDYLAPVTALLRQAGGVSGIAHMTVDEKVIEAGTSQRRPGPHVDGCFIPKKMEWGHDSGGGGGWRHYCNDVGGEKIGRMPIIVASNVSGCRAWKGIFFGQPKSDGDLSHLLPQLGTGELLPPNVGYLLSPDCIHESIVFEKKVVRSFLRIALPLEFSFIGAERKNA